MDASNEDAWVERLAKETAYSFINKIYFYRIAEDKGIVKPKLTKNALERLKESFGYKELCDLAFKEILRVDYRAIFEHSLFDTIEFDEKVIGKIVTSLEQYDFREINSDVLGKIYEHHISVKERKELGQFYTPKKVIDYILGRVGVTEKKTVLDPACGSGGFLISIYDRLKKKHAKKGLSEAAAHERILKDNLFGIDVNPFAVQLSAMNLALKGIEHKTDSINVINADSLLFGLNAWMPIPHKDLDNNHKEKSIEGTIPKKVNVVVGNPPYVRIRNVSKEKLKAYQKNLETAKDRFDLFSLFIERGIKFLDNGGKLGYIVSNGLLTNDTLAPIRKYILDTCIIEEIADLGKGVFEEANVSTTILILRKEKDKAKRDSSHARIVTGIEEKGRAASSHKVSQSRFLKSHLNKFAIDEKHGRTLKKIERDTSPLGELVEGSCGIQVWKNKADKEKNPDYLSGSKDNETYKPIIEGKDITRFSYKFNQQYVLYSKKLLERAREERFFTAPRKIVMRYIGKKLIGAIDNKKHYAQKSVLCLIPKKENTDLKYILAIINSELMNWHYLKSMGENAYPRINLNYVLKFPIKNAKQKQKKEINSIVDKIEATSNKQGDEKSRLIRELNAKITKLYGISEKELK